MKITGACRDDERVVHFILRVASGVRLRYRLLSLLTKVHVCVCDFALIFTLHITHWCYTIKIERL